MDQLLAKLPLLLLVSSRMAGVTTASPIFSNRFLLPQVRVALTILLAMLVLPSARVAPGAEAGTALLAACVLELLVGLLIGFLSQLVFAAVQMAGSLLDLDMGFAMAQILDPVTGHSDPILSSFFQTLGIVLYLAMNGHHNLLRALAGSYEAIPAGGLTLTTTAPLHVVSLFGFMLMAGVQMVLPFIAVMLLASVVLAGLSRAVPQMQVFALGVGAKALVGLGILVLLLPYFQGFLETLFANGHAEMLRTLELVR